MEVSPKKLVIGLALVFLLGVMFAIVNGYYVEQEGTTLPIIVYAIAVLSLIVGAALVFMFQNRLNKMQLKRLLKVLPADERKLIAVLMDKNNELEQNRLVAYSGLSKVKVSRVIKVLEAREILEKKSLGNTNLIILKL